MKLPVAISVATKLKGSPHRLVGVAGGGVELGVTGSSVK